MLSIIPAFFKKPWVPPLIWTLISVIVYFWWGDGQDFIRANVVAFFVDVFIFLFSPLIWLAFFAQFVLPVRTFRDRQKIFGHVLA